MNEVELDRLMINFREHADRFKILENEIKIMVLRNHDVTVEKEDGVCVYMQNWWEIVSAKLEKVAIRK